MRAGEEHVPKYPHYKPKNLGVVRIDGRDHYLGGLLPGNWSSRNGSPPVD